MGSTNAPYLDFVSTRLGFVILRFCKDNLKCTFHADDLREYVLRTAGPSAPASADRVLRDLRQRGLVRYWVVDRRKSLYFVDMVVT